MPEQTGGVAVAEAPPSSPEVTKPTALEGEVLPAQKEAQQLKTDLAEIPPPTTHQELNRLAISATPAPLPPSDEDIPLVEAELVEEPSKETQMTTPSLKPGELRTLDEGEASKFDPGTPSAPTTPSITESSKLNEPPATSKEMRETKWRKLTPAEIAERDKALAAEKERRTQLTDKIIHEGIKAGKTHEEITQELINTLIIPSEDPEKERTKQEWVTIVLEHEKSQGKSSEEITRIISDIAKDPRLAKDIHLGVEVIGDTTLFEHVRSIAQEENPTITTPEAAEAALTKLANEPNSTEKSRKMRLLIILLKALLTALAAAPVGAAALAVGATGVTGIVGNKQ